jgi:hypothetical protein
MTKCLYSNDKEEEVIKEEVIKEEENEDEDDNQKLTHITFNNFDGVKIKKHNDSLKKDSNMETNFENESIDHKKKNSDLNNSKNSVKLILNNNFRIPRRITWISIPL